MWFSPAAMSARWATGESFALTTKGHKMILQRKSMNEIQPASRWQSRFAEFIPWRWAVLFAGLSTLFFLLAADAA